MKTFPFFKKIENEGFSIIGLLCGNKTEITFFSLKFINFFKMAQLWLFSRFFDTHKNVNNTFIISHSFLHFRKRTFIDNSRSNGYFFFLLLSFHSFKNAKFEDFSLIYFFFPRYPSYKAGRSLTEALLPLNVCHLKHTHSSTHTWLCVQ